ncbi:MAG: hypothetical protein LQ340_003080 [Diploschistes diacapsis]|nr:MAG: hypothetical protein LQ340_003080 [Diploschistes diacapsis]
MQSLVALLLAGLAVTDANLVLKRQSPTSLPPAGVTGIATFNSYSNQVSSGQTTNCGTFASFGAPTYGAAVGDLSPDLSLNPTYGCGPLPADLTTDCNEVADNTYQGPNCKANTPCGTCYKVTNQGGFNGEMLDSQPVPGVGKFITVMIIDACPHNSAWNYCKTSVTNLAEKCMAPGQDALDIDQSAYSALTGVDYAGGVPNLSVKIESVDCSAPVSG